MIRKKGKIIVKVGDFSPPGAKDVIKFLSLSVGKIFEHVVFLPFIVQRGNCYPTSLAVCKLYFPSGLCQVDVKIQQK